jgi:hypothetical protein
MISRNERTYMTPAEFGSEQAASMGGSARAKSMTKEQRSESSRKAALARWESAGKDPVPKATHEGILRIGELSIPCAVLEDGTRVLSESGMVSGLGLYRSGAVQKRERESSDGAPLPLFVANKNIKPFVDEDLSAVLRAPLWFIPKEGGTKNKGVNAKAIPKICNVWLRARDAGALKGVRQTQVAINADMLMRGLAEVGIVALVDEATGFQYVRPRRDLEKYLETFLAESLRKWVRTFPADYFKHLCRLRHVELRADMKLPQYFGTLTNNLIYRRMAPGLLKRLKDRRDELGSGKLHTALSLDFGVPEVLVHLGTVVGIMKINVDYDVFEKQLDRIAPIYPADPTLFDNPDEWDSSKYKLGDNP